MARPGSGANRRTADRAFSDDAAFSPPGMPLAFPPLPHRGRGGKPRNARRTTRRPAAGVGRPVSRMAGQCLRSPDGRTRASVPLSPIGGEGRERGRPSPFGEPRAARARPSTGFNLGMIEVSQAPSPLALSPAPRGRGGKPRNARQRQGVLQPEWEARIRTAGQSLRSPDCRTRVPVPRTAGQSLCSPSPPSGERAGERGRPSQFGEPRAARAGPNSRVQPWNVRGLPGPLSPRPLPRSAGARGKTSERSAAARRPAACGRPGSGRPARAFVPRIAGQEPLFPGRPARASVPPLPHRGRGPGRGGSCTRSVTDEQHAPTFFQPDMPSPFPLSPIGGEGRGEGAAARAP
jgi:hypothetical protein